MITIIYKNFKPISQAVYNKLISDSTITQLSCTCGTKGSLIKHGYYTRYIKQMSDKTPLCILRVKCKHCGKTHALLPYQIIPYSQITFSDTLAIVKVFHTSKRLALKDYEEIMTSNLTIDFSNVKYIIRSFLKYWYQRLLTYDISLDANLTFACFKYFNRHFMQIKGGSNILFSMNHIS